jgi:cytosine/adenosine deaminase-related metal-dependent hydrolase
MKSIRSKFLVTCEGRPISDGRVVFDDDGRVVSFGNEKAVEGEPEEYFDGIVCPGFTNAHCHLELSHLKGYFRQATGMDGFIQQINALREVVGPEQRLADMTREMNSLWAQGVGAMGDISNCAESFGLKAKSPLYTRTFLEVFGTEPQDADEIVRNVLELQRQAAAAGIDAAPTPHSPYTSSALLIQKVSAEGLKSGYLSYHSQESLEEEDMLRHGTGPLAEDYHARGVSTPEVADRSALVYFLGILQKIHPAPFKEHILLIHNVATDQESIDAAKAILKNVFWVLCPLSNWFIHRALPPIGLMRANGLRLCVGTDSLSSNTVLSIIEELKCLQKNFPEVSLEEMLGWACLNGAEAIGVSNRFGSFKPGKQPGAVFISNVTDDFKLTPESESKRIL